MKLLQLTRWPIALRARERAAEPALAPSTVETGDHVSFSQVAKQYPGAVGQVAALTDISFGVRRGEVFGIIGRSGAGKSTLLRTINALESPTAGRVLVNGVDLASLDEDGLVQLRRRIGMIFQHFNLLSSLTVRDNIGLPMRVAGATPAQIRARVDSLLQLVGLAEKADVYPAKLSGGQKQRVGIARALVHQPEILLCDEATSALDPETTQSILALVRDISARMGLTVILITHDMAVIREVCQRVLVLDHGRAVELGEVWQVFGAPRADATRALLQPLQHGLPADLAHALVADLQGAPGEAIVSLHFQGEVSPQGIRLQDLAVLGPHATFLHGGLDRILGHAQGSLLVSLPADELPQARAQVAQRFGQNDVLKVLGYVPARH